MSKKQSPKVPIKKRGSPNALTSDWVKTEHGVMVCPGDYSILNERFKGHTEQGAAVCIMACAFGNLKRMNTWTTKTLNQICDIGTTLHLKTRQMSTNKCLPFIQPPKVYKYFFLGDVKVSMRIGLEVVKATVPQNAQVPQYMEEVMTEFLSTNNSGIVSSHGKHMAFWKFDKYLFLFDPREHDNRGGKWEGLKGRGNPCCLRFSHLAPLVNVIVDFLPLEKTTKYKIYPCNVEKVVKVDTKPPETIDGTSPLTPETPKSPKSPKKIHVVKAATHKTPPPEQEAKVDEAGDKLEVKLTPSMTPPERPKLESVTNYKVLLEGRMGILRGSTHEGKQPSKSPLQSLANALVALTTLRIHKSKIWIPKTVDEILILGLLYGHAAKSGDDKKIQFGDDNYTPILNKYGGAVGYLQSTDDRILNLEQALSNYFLDNDCAVLMGPHIVALWKEDDRFYMFDANERDQNGRIVTDQPGVACVTWYSNVKDLVEIYMSNVPKESHNERFILCKVTIENFEPLADDWHRFRALAMDKWILRGTFSQNDRRFPEDSRNAQCTANAAMALTFKELKPEQDWDPNTMDQVLIEGDEYYRACVAHLQEKNLYRQPQLMVDELKRSFNVENKKVELKIDDCLVNGIINATSDSGIADLKKGFGEFFGDSEAGIVTANGLSMAVWKRDDVYYYYDSHSRNEFGLVCLYGTACLLRLGNVEDLAKVMMTNLGADKQNLYNISRIVVSLFDITEDGIVKPPLHYYEAVGEYIAILRSNVSEKDEKFELNAGKQAVPMCLAALAFNALTPSFDWNKEDLDQVLGFGDKLYVESMEANYKEELPEELNVDEISTNNVKRELTIGSNLLQIEIEDYSMGNFEDNLKEAIETLHERLQEEDNEIFQSVLESRDLKVALWHDGNLIYLFDPKPRDPTGQIYGKDDWSAKIEPPEEEEQQEGEAGDTTDENKTETTDEEPPEDEIPLVEAPVSAQKLDEEEEPEDEEVEEEEPEEPPAVQKMGSAYWRLQEEGGKACVLRFSRVEDLINHLVENSPPNHRQELEYTLKTIKITNTPVLRDVYDREADKADEIVGDWYDFKEVDYGRWILRATKNFNDEFYPENNRGKQATPMCIVALAFGFLYEVALFKPMTIDSILAYGDRFRTVCLRLLSKMMKEQKDPPVSEEDMATILSTVEFKIHNYSRSVCVGEKLAKWDVQMKTIAGDITSKDSGEVQNVPGGVLAFFGDHTFGLLECKNYMVAIWQHGDMFYMFDPHLLGPSGIKSPVGVACITRYKNLEDLAAVYLENLPKLGENFFEIHALTFEGRQCPRERQPEDKEELPPKLGGFNVVMLGKLILRGTLALDCKKFDQGVNRYAAAIAFVALAVSLYMDTEAWTTMMINEVIAMGEQIYEESVKKLEPKFDPWSERLDIFRVVTDFRIGSLRVNCALRFMEQKGLVDVKNKDIPNLRQGLERFFEENSHGILLMDRLILAIWEESFGDQTFIYIYDPNSRGSTGLPTQGGLPCVMKFCNAKVAADHLMACLVDQNKTKTVFVIVPVEIVIASIQHKHVICRTMSKKELTSSFRSPRCVTSTPVTCPTKVAILEQKRTLRRIAEEDRRRKEAKRLHELGRTAIYEISNSEAIIRGLSCMIPDREGPVNFVAFALMVIAGSRMDQWTHKDIDAILEMGYQLHIDSCVSYKPGTMKLKLDQVLKRLKVGDLEFKIHMVLPVTVKVSNQDAKNALANILSVYFLSKNFCLLGYEDFLVSLYFKSGYYYLFDPYSRDLYGNRAERGTAVVMRFGDLESLVDKLLRNFDPPEDIEHIYVSIIWLFLEGVEPL